MAWQYPVPPRLYKYLGPGRTQVLRDCRIRFSQRAVLPDDHELLPDYERFGTVDEIERQITRTGLSLLPLMTPREQAQRIADSPQHQEKAKEAAIANIKSINHLGILSLTETPCSKEMWAEYGGGGRGFVLGFDTAHSGFGKLTAPQGVGKVSYDAGFATFLGMMENAPFEPLFRKRVNYSFELEWRSIRMLKDLENHGGDIFLSPFEPECVREIIVKTDFESMQELRTILADNVRFGGAEIVTTD